MKAKDKAFLAFAGTFVIVEGVIITRKQLMADYINGLNRIPKHQNPLASEKVAGPRVTDQTQRGVDGGDGRRVDPKPGADEQNKFRWPWDDDDDLDDGDPAPEIRAANINIENENAGIDREYDEFLGLSLEEWQALGGAVLFCVIIFGIVAIASQNRNRFVQQQSY